MDIIRPSEGRVSGSTPDVGTRFKSRAALVRPGIFFGDIRLEASVRIPADILVHAKSETLELVYPDGSRWVFPFEFLRVESPSAEVQGHSPDEATLQVGKRGVKIVSVEPVGAYALKLVFSDGHDTGLYSWDYFDLLGREQEKRWEAYLGKLSAAGASREPGDPANKPFLPKPRQACGLHH